VAKAGSLAPKPAIFGSLLSPGYENLLNQSAVRRSTASAAGSILIRPAPHWGEPIEQTV
jgi:hypothetical protein